MAFDSKSCNAIENVITHHIKPFRSIFSNACSLGPGLDVSILSIFKIKD